MAHRTGHVLQRTIEECGHACNYIATQNGLHPLLRGSERFCAIEYSCAALTSLGCGKLLRSSIRGLEATQLVPVLPMQCLAFLRAVFHASAPTQSTSQQGRFGNRLDGIPTWSM